MSPTEGKPKLDRKLAESAAARSQSPVLPKSPTEPWVPTQEWVTSWKSKLPLQTIMRLLQVLVPQVNVQYDQPFQTLQPFISLSYAVLYKDLFVEESIKDLTVKIAGRHYCQHL